MAACCTVASAQTTIAFQGFEAGDSWSISSGSGSISTATGVLDTPASQRIFAGTRSWQLIGTTGTLTLSSVSLTGYTDIFVRYRLSATSGTGGAGVDSTDYARAYLALNGAAFPSNSAATADISIVGANNSRWGYNATLTATTTAGTNLQVASPQNGTSTNNYSIGVINIPNGSSAAALQFVARVNGINELFNFDNITLTGTVPSAATWDANGSTAGTGGTGTWDLTNRSFTNGDLIWNNTVNGPATAVTFGSTAGTVTAGTGISVNAMSFTVSGYTVQSNTLTLTGTNPTISVPTASHSATISSNLAGSDTLTKSGAGQLVLTGSASTYSGTTTVSGGTLIVNGAHSGGDTYTVSSAGTLGGSGTITPAANASVVINGGIAPGDSSVAKLTLNTSGTGNTTFAPGGVYEWNLTDATGAAGVAWDQLALKALSITATSGSKFTIKVVGINPSNFSITPPAGSYSWAIATTTAISGFDLSVFTIDTSSFTPTVSGGFNLRQNGNDLELYYVPEPGRVLWLVGMMVLLPRRRPAKHP